MIILDKNIDTNIICVTATESSTLTGTTGYSMSIISQADKTEITDIQLTDTSEYKTRYNTFEFDNSFLDKLNLGMYNYIIYQFNDDEEILVENGLLKVITTEIISPVYPEYNDNNRDTFITYE